MAWRQLAYGIGAAILVTAGGLGRGDAGAQDVALAGRGPKFFTATPKAAPRELDVRSLPLLRQQVAINLDNMTLRDALAEITRQTGLTFVYMRDVIDPDTRVDLKADRISVAAAITAVLLDAGVDVLFSSSRQAALVKRAQVRPGTIVGRVTDAKAGEKIAGVDVFLEGTRWRTTTDSSGRYRLAEIDSGVYTLTARRLGYAKQSRKVTVHGEREDTVNLALAPVATSLQELVTTATGQQRRKDLGNDITTIRADSILRHAPIRNLTDLLQNRVPDLAVQHTSGAPGDPARLRLRGLGSVLHASDPVVIVDGARIYAAQSEARSGNLTNGLAGSLSRPPATDRNGRPIDAGGVPAPSPLDQIDPNIIEKIEVFKGPSAATMYGADAANGVIVITTKRGRPGPTSWSASVTHGRTTYPGEYPTGYYRWGRDVYNGRQRFCTLIDVQCLQDSLVRFQALNQQALTVLGRGQRTGLSLTASGGTQALTYSVTGSYTDEAGLLQLPNFEVERFRTLFNRNAPEWMQRPHHLKTWSVSSNIMARLSSSADVTLSTSLSRSEQQRTSLENQLAPLSGTYIDTVNSRYYRPQENGYALNTTADVLKDYYVRTTASDITLTTQLAGAWRPRSWFNGSAQAALNIIPRDHQLLLPAGLLAASDSGTLSRGTGRSIVGTFNLQGQLRKPLRHRFFFETSFGTNVVSTTTNDLVTTASGLIPGTRSISGAQRINATDAATNTSVFGWYVEPRIYGERLAISTGLRLDGGSANGTRLTGNGTQPFHFRDLINPGQLFGLRSLARNLLALPKLNGTWTISEEPWFPLNSLFSSLRLRGAYGQAQTQPSPTDRLRLYSSSLGQFGQILTLTTIGNTHLRPERSTEFEGGFDADLLDSRMSLQLTAYRKMRVDALMPVALPGSINGGGSLVQNIGNIRNTGYNVALNLTPLRQSATAWSVALTVSHLDNKLVKIGQGVVPNPAQGIVEGYPVGGRWARPILGFADQNGDSVLQPQEIQVGDSLVYMGRLYANYQTSLSTDLALFDGAIGISASFSYEAGATQVDQTATRNWVLARALVDPSTPLPQQASVLALNRTDYGLTQGIATFRFNTFSLNYRPPPRVAQLLRARQLDLALQGSNLGLHSTYKGKDPDVNSWSPGENIMDTGQLPQPRTWQLRVGIQF